jgi:hypothetical protein
MAAGHLVGDLAGESGGPFFQRIIDLARAQRTGRRVVFHVAVKISQPLVFLNALQYLNTIL